MIAQRMEQGHFEAFAHLGEFPHKGQPPVMPEQ